jgi:pyruvate dehydrogenase E2 component (dihydrolipoamide acetyltransferase)
MAEKVLMLALSPTMETGTIARWNKQEGDSVEEGELLCEVETDKATMEYESLNKGTLLRIIAKEGSEAKVGEPIAIVGEKGEDISGLLHETAQRSEEAAEGPGLDAAPSIREKRELEKSPDIGEGSEAEEHLPEGVKASPLARKMAQQNNIELSGVKGSGPDGRIIKKDIETVLKAPGAAPGVEIRAAAKMPTEEIKVTAKRRVIAKRLSESKFSAPHYHLRVIVAMDDLMAARSRLNRELENKVSFNAFLIRFAAEALKKHGMVNAGWKEDTITLYKRADIGLAVAQPDGLITPVVRDCWNKGIIEIDREMRVLIDRALNNALKPEEYTGATFTITNLGSYGIHDFTAVINPPGSAILSVGEIRKEPVFDENENIKVQSNMVLSLSCDHRVVDGAVGALFLRDLKQMIENPVRVLY